MSDIYEALRAAATAVTERLGTEVRVGYIGNSGRSGDHRSWYVGVRGIRGGFYWNNVLSKGGFRTDNLASLLAFIEEGGVETLIGQAKGRWDSGTDYGYRFAPVRDVWGEVVETAEQIEAALADIPAIPFIPRNRSNRTLAL